MAHKKTPDQISYNMSRIKSKNTTIELRFEEELKTILTNGLQIIQR